MAKEVRGIRSVVISGKILQTLADAREPMMLKDLAQETNLPPAQCHAYLTSLKNIALVDQDVHTGLYRMGSLAMQLGVSWLKTSPISSAAIQELKSLTEQLGITSTISLWSKFGPTIVHLNEGNHPTALNLRQGALFSVTGTATGRLFAAFNKEEEIETLIKSELDNSNQGLSLGGHVTADNFHAQLDLIKSKGYALAQGSPIPDINAIACPVFDKNSSMIMAITLIASPKHLHLDDNNEAVVRLNTIAKSLSNFLHPKQ